MKRHLIFGLAGLFLLGGCRSPQPRLLGDCFERSETVGMQPLAAQGMDLPNPRKIAWADGKLVVLSAQGERYFSVFDAERGELLYRFGHRGKSGTELLQPYNLLMAGRAVGAYDMTLKRIVWYDSLPDEGTALVPNRTVGLAPDPAVAWSIGLAASPAGGYVGECIASGPERFAWSDSTGACVALFGEYPTEIEALPENSREKFERKFACYGSMAFCGETFLHAALNRNELQFYDMPTRADRRPEPLRHYDLGVPDDRTGEAFMASFDAAASDSLFFVLYRGRWFTELNLKIDADQVLVFDRQGRALKRFVLDEPAIAIAVTPDGRRLYTLGTDRESGEPRLYSASLGLDEGD